MRYINFHTIYQRLKLLEFIYCHPMNFSKPTPVAELLALQKSQKSAESSKHKGAGLESSASEDCELPRVSDFEMAQLKRQMECVSREIHLCRISNQGFHTFNCLLSMI